ncbi:MAG: hypothetical protein Q8L92_17770 [Rubrivivax sp.]|nr:hypothetical protein [Rubrivivax sp.]
MADPSSDTSDRALICDYLPHITSHDAGEFRLSGLSVDGAWDRLSAVAYYAADFYVVQIDVDTVAVRDLVGLRCSISDGVVYSVGTGDDSEVKSMAGIAACACWRQSGKEHIQGRSESALDQFDPSSRDRYIRECSDFADFTHRSIDPEAGQAVSTGLDRLLGERWQEWGNERFLSSLLVTGDVTGQLRRRAGPALEHAA